MPPRLSCLPRVRHANFHLKYLIIPGTKKANLHYGDTKMIDLKNKQALTSMSKPGCGYVGCDRIARERNQALAWRSLSAQP